LDDIAAEFVVADVEELCADHLYDSVDLERLAKLQQVLHYLIALLVFYQRAHVGRNLLLNAAAHVFIGYTFHELLDHSAAQRVYAQIIHQPLLLRLVRRVLLKVGQHGLQRIHHTLHLFMVMVVVRKVLIFFIFRLTF